MLPLWRRRRAFRSTSTAARARGTGRSQLALEILEAREVPAVTLVSAAADGGSSSTANGESTATRLGSVSDNGQFVVYLSDATNLVTDQVDTNSENDIFLRDTVNNTTTLITGTFGSTTATANGESFVPVISGDGNWIAFFSQATDLINNTTINAGTNQLYLYHRPTGQMTLASYSNAGLNIGSNGDDIPTPGQLSISDDGLRVAYISDATNLTPNQGTSINGNSFSPEPLNAFVYDRGAGSNSMVSHIPNQTEVGGNEWTTLVTISGNGNAVVFHSYATNLFVGQDQIQSDSEINIFYHDFNSDTTVMVTHEAGNVNRSGASLFDRDFFVASVSDDGQRVAYVSKADDLVANQVDADGDSFFTATSDVFLYTFASESSVLVSRKFGTTATSDSVPAFFTISTAVISGNGNWVAYTSNANELLAAAIDNSNLDNVYLANVTNPSTLSNALVSHTVASQTAPTGGGLPSISNDGAFVAFTGSNDAQTQVAAVRYTTSDGSVASVGDMTDANNQSGPALLAAISGDGSTVAFNSVATDLVANDTNGNQDVFIAGTSSGSSDPTLIQFTTLNVPASPNVTFTQFTTVADPPGRVFQYTLVNGPGDTNNNQFTVDNTGLRTIAQFTLQPSYSVRLRTTDVNDPTSFLEQVVQFTLVNPPTDLAVNQFTVPATPNTSFAQFTVTGDPIRVYTPVLVPDFGDNALFTIDNGALSTGPNFPATGQTSYSVRVSTVDPEFASLVYSETFSFTLVNPPTSVNTNSNAAPALANTAVAQLTAAGAGDPNRTYTYSLVSGTGDTDNSAFTLTSGGALSTGATAPGQSTLSVRVRATDTAFPSLFFDQVLSFALVTAPSDIALSGAATTATPNTTVGALSVPGSNRTYTYSLVTGTGDTDNGKFAISGTGALVTGSAFPPTAPTTYSVLVRATDAAFPGLFTEEAFTISVVNVPAVPILTAPPLLQTVETAPVALNITATPGDANSVVTVTISGAPAFVTFSNPGTLNSDGSRTFTQAQLAGLTVTGADDGSFVLTVVATATLPGGTIESTATAAITVGVANVAPVVSVSAPATFNPMSAVSITVAATNVGQDAVQSVTVSWGDGVVETFASAGTFTHQYLVLDRAYTVSVSVTDEDGTVFVPGVTLDAEFATPQQALVAELYQALLGMNADQAGLEFFSSAIAAGVPIPVVVNFFVNSPVYQINVINSLFVEHLGRDATPLELFVSLPLLGTGGAQAVQANILGSLEYYVKSGGTPETYVSALGTAVFGAPLDPATVGFLADSLRFGVTVADLAEQLALSPIGVAADLAETYEALLGTPIDPVNLLGFVPLETTDPEVFLSLILGSPQFASRLATV